MEPRDFDILAGNLDAGGVVFVEEYLKDVRDAGYSRSAWLTYWRRAGVDARTRIWNNPQATRSVLTAGIAAFVAHLAWSLRVSFVLGPDPAVAYLWASGLTALAASSGPSMASPARG